ncbi:MAG TPA: hypothetical protein VLW50_26810 [Streptosporangiaceae bacterium]|nr:hypothetical protein [Streptosporangiaceae bacterium]
MESAAVKGGGGLRDGIRLCAQYFTSNILVLVENIWPHGHGTYCVAHSAGVLALALFNPVLAGAGQ